MPSNVHDHAFIIRPQADLVQRHPELRRLSHALALKYACHELVTDDELQKVGQRLWNALDLDDEFERELDTAGVQILPIVIESDQAAIQQLPWEILYHPAHGFLGQSERFALSRRINGGNGQNHVNTGPLRVLLFTSLPDDLEAETSRLNVEEEQAQVQEALMPWIAKGLVELEMPDDGRLSTLKRVMHEFQPHLVFLSGHGKFYHEPHAKEPPYGVFLCESETGSSEAVREEELAEAFIGAQVQALVLSACESGRAASDALNNGLTRHLSQQGIPHVIGMRESVLDRAGTLFAHSLCDAIARQERVDVALQQARQAITKPLKDSVWREEFDRSGLAELSLGQWCLPMLISRDASRPLLDWNFAPQTVEPHLSSQSFQKITLPPRFVGRRSELRALKNRLRSGELCQLLITGPGGQGKTALAGKLVQDLQQRGCEVFAWSARTEDRDAHWNAFQFDLQLQLNKDNAERYDRMAGRCADERGKAEFLLRLLLSRTTNRLILFFDNLESLQQPDTLALDDARIQAWIEAAQTFLEQGLTLILTSRWQLPGWPDDEHWPLSHANYGDFLQMARYQNLPLDFFLKRDRLRRVYHTLHGNGRGLEFFAAAIQGMNLKEEAAFLKTLRNVEAELQTNMALDQILQQLTNEERELLRRLPVYQTPIQVEGILKIALDLPVAPETLLRRLMAVSLVERHENREWHTLEYHCPPVVVDRLSAQGIPAPGRELYGLAAAYQHYLFRHERRTLSQAMIVHQALRAAEEQEEADRFALDKIVGKLSLHGFYRTVLDEWLPEICRSETPIVKAEALGQTGKQYLHLGEYEAALAYLTQALAIQREIGDKAGEGRTLNNLSQIYDARGEYEAALEYLTQSLAIRREIGDKAGEGTTLNNLAGISKARGEYEAALAYLTQSLAIQREIGDKAGEGTTLNNLSQISKARGEYEAALAYLTQSLAIQREIGDKAGEGTTLNNLSQIFKARGEYEAALAYLTQSLAIQREIGDKAGEGTTLNNLSALSHARGEYEAALAYLTQSLAIQREIGDKAGEGTTLNNLSALSHARGEYEAALAYLTQALAIQREIGDKAGEGATLNNLSQIYDARGEYEAALAYLTQALAIQREIGDKAGEGTTLNNLSQIFKARGEYEAALAYLTQALAIQREIGDKAGEGTTLNNLSQIFKARGEYEAALAYLTQSLAIQREIGDKAGEGTTLNNLSQIFKARGEYEAALAYLTQALAIQREIGDNAGLCVTLFNMGHIHYQNDDVPQALSAWVTAYLLAKPMHLRQALDALENLAGQLGLPGGLDAWEALAQQMQEQD